MQETGSPEKAAALELIDACDPLHGAAWAFGNFVAYRVVDPDLKCSWCLAVRKVSPVWHSSGWRRLWGGLTNILDHRLRMGLVFQSSAVRGRRRYKQFSLARTAEALVSEPEDRKAAEGLLLGQAAQ